MALLVATVTAAAEPKRVLLLHSFGPNFAPFSVFSRQFRADLVQKLGAPVDFYEVSLETARFGGAEAEGPFVDYLLALFGERRLDLAVPIGGPATRFVLGNRQKLFPSTPMLFAGLEERLVKDIPLTGNDTVVAIRIDLPALIEGILQVLPETTNIAIVLGNSPLEKYWLGEARRAFQQFGDRVKFTWFNELSFTEMLARGATLPPRSAILFGVLYVDVAGVPHEDNAAMAVLGAVANAPMFGIFDHLLGQGIVGGPLIRLGEASAAAADVAVRILRGEPPAGIKTPAIGPGVPIFDWRQLGRWEIAEAALPPGRVIAFSEPSLWDEYKWYFLAAILFAAAQTLLVVALLANRRRLRKAHAELLASEDRIHLAANAAKLYLWIWDIARDRLTTTENAGVRFRRSSSRPRTLERFLRTVHAADREAIRHAVRRAVDGGTAIEVEYRLAYPRKTVRRFSARGGLEFDAQGKPVRLNGVSMEVTELRQAEAAAHELGGRLINAHEEERARLGRELHDDLTQRLALLAIQAAREEKREGASSSAEALRRMREDLVRLGEDVHQLSYRLHPSILEDLGLVEALNAECERFSKLEALPVDVRTKGVPEGLSLPAALGIFRITQEALRNVARHASASKIEVDLRDGDGGLQLNISDDGIGFDPNARRSRPSLGLESMRQRIGFLAGRLNISSSSKGTTISAWVPLREEHHESPTRSAR